MAPKVPEIELPANKIELRANKIEETEDLNDTVTMKHANCGVIALMELARDGAVGPFKDKWQHFNLNRGVAFEPTDVKFGEQQQMELAKLYAKQIQALAKLCEDEEEEPARALAKLDEDEKRDRALAKLCEDKVEKPARALAKFYEDEAQVEALAKLYEDEEQARALAKFDKDKEQTRPLANFMTNVKKYEEYAITWITREVVKIVNDVQHGVWRKKKNQSPNGDKKAKHEAVSNVLCGVGCRGAKDRVPDRKAKEEVGKGGRHVMKVVRNALPAIYPGRTVLHMAAANGNVEIVRAIREVKDVDLNKRDVFGYTPLHLACYSTHPKRHEVIKILLASQDIDANVAARATGYYFTALHLAVKAKSTDIVEMLLNWSPIGKNYHKVLYVSTKSTSGWTVLHLAVQHKILEKDDGKKADFVTMIVEIIRFINTHSPESINKSDKTKSTPLHTSVAAGDHQLVELLLEDGDKIDPELLDDKRRTALEIAVHQHDYKMVEKIQHYLERTGMVGNHQAYTDSANAILVGAALLVTVTFAAWVQIPTNDSTLFWVFISLSFYFAVATFISAAGAAIPCKGSTLGLIRRAVLLSAIFLAISLACAVAAFATAGFLIIPLGIENQRKVVATTAIGGFVCLFCLLSFVRKILRALGLLFLWLDYSAQKQLAVLADGVLADLTYGIKSMLGEERVPDTKKWYDKNIEGWYLHHVTKNFKDEEDPSDEEDSTSSHDGSKSTTDSSPSSSGNKESGGPPSPEIC